jgi:cytochrome d ubiquinol oxidase subunit II
MPLALWLAGAVMVGLTLYAMGAGADFGGGVWDLLSSGPRARAQRETIAHAIGPIWEANHVWLILVIVLLYVCFPTAFAAITIALHVPLTIMLLGVVFRGSAFTFRSYDDESDVVRWRWGRIFAIASIVTPLMLGVCVGAVASGRIRVVDGRVRTGFFESWIAPFPIAIGFLTIALFAFLGAVYLTRETSDPELQDDFRLRALASGVGVGVLAFAALALAYRDAPLIREGLLGRPWSLPFHSTTALVALSALRCLWRRRYAAARALAIMQVALVLWGWAFAQYPYIVYPDLTLWSAAAPGNVLRAVLVALAAGAVVLFPSMWYLFRVFKGAPART